MRAERLIRTLLVLQRKGTITAPALAAELEVSLATARRDLEALGQAGIPVYAQSGRGGGWRLLGGARTDLTGLTRADSLAVFRALGRSSPDATRKLLQALPETFRAEAARVAESSLQDPAPWGQRAGTADALGSVLDAIATRTQLDVRYRHRDGTESELRLHPWAVVQKAERTYLLADGGTRRVFRLDRLDRTVATTERAKRPAPDEIEHAWAVESERIEALRTREVVTLRASEQALRGLRAQFGPAMSEPEPAGDAVVVRIGTSSAWMAAAQLAGHAEHVEVLAPDVVRDELRRIGAALVRRYGSVAT